MKHQLSSLLRTSTKMQKSRMRVVRIQRNRKLRSLLVTTNVRPKSCFKMT